MRSEFKPWLTGALVAAVAVGAATLVRAQQDGAPPNPTPPALRNTDVPEPEAPPAKIPTPKAPKIAAPDADDQADASPAPSKPDAPAKPVVPLKRPKYAVAIIQTLDKV